MTNFCLTATIFAFHNELIRLAYADFEKLVHGKIGDHVCRAQTMRTAIYMPLVCRPYPSFWGWS
jgi:hypothetical protein